MNKSFNKRLMKGLPAFLLVTLNSLTAIAQKEMDPITAEFNNLSSKIEASLKSDKEVYNKMKGEMEAISKITDDVKRTEAVNKYRGDHLQQYGEAVKRAGIQMNQVIADWERKFPDYLFSINNNYGVEVVKRPREKKAHEDNSAPRPSSVTTNITNFHPTHHVDCQLAGYSGVDMQPMSIKAWTTAAVAGGCHSDGDLLNATKLPLDARTITLKLNGKITVKGFALGVLGAAIFDGCGFISADFDFDNGITFQDQVCEQLLAPFLWYVQINETKNVTPILDLSDHRGSTIKINMHADVSSISSLCCGTNGEVRVSMNSATLISN